MNFTSSRKSDKMDRIKKNRMLHLLETALQREIDAFNYYMKAGSKAHDPETESVLIQLAEEERKHQYFLNREIQKIDHLLSEEKGDRFIDTEDVQYPIPDSPEFKRLHSIRSVEMAAVSLPVELLGGDYVDTLVLDRADQEPALGIFLYDVMGHGLEATHIKALGKQAFGELREAWSSGDKSVDMTSPGRVMEELNRRVAAYCQEAGRFITSFYGIIDTTANTLIYTSAGHEPPILIKESGEYIHLSETNLLLGAAKDVTYTETTVSVGRGDILILFSDGITEATNRGGKMWERDRLRQTVQKMSKASSRDIIGHIFKTLKSFLKGQPITDEFTLVVMKVGVG